MTARLLVFENARELRAFVGAQRNDGQRIGFVPTMGNLHAGHHALVRHANECADCVIASVFVNPTQFGPDEDFDRYPRTQVEDIDGLEQAGCHAVFLPSVREIYPGGTDAGTRVEVGALGRTLEGASRPGHFDGVATVVTTLFHIVQPDVAVFGRKDFQQLLVIRQLVRDLAFAIDIEAVPTLREADGLAMSSRNRYLSAREHSNAATIHATLTWMADQFRNGGRVDAIEREAAARLAACELVPDYAVLRRAADLEPLATGSSAEAIALIAARAGATRLIDNLPV